MVQVDYPKDELERNDETRAWAMALVGAITLVQMRFTKLSAENR